MPKKIDEAEVKKECPSCGLGVALDSTVCEFCGWDFDEEDEWILQIEKLERDLLLEKQKFEPGTVNEKIESTLHAPALEMKDSSKPAPAKPAPKQVAEASKKAPPPAPKRAPPPEAKKPAPVQAPVVERPAATRPAVSKPMPASAPEPAPQEAAAGKIRRMRIVKGAPSAPAQTPPQEEGGQKKRLVRKVKQG